MGSEDEKLRAKRERLEAWKKEREAKKALDEAKAKAMALAGKSATRECLSYFMFCVLIFEISHHLIACLRVRCGVRPCPIDPPAQPRRPHRSRSEGSTHQK